MLAVPRIGFPVSAIAGEVTPLLVIHSGRLDRLAVAVYLASMLISQCVK